MIKKKLTYGLLAALAATTAVTAAQAGGRCGGFYVELEPFYIRAHDTLLSRYPYAIGFFDEFSGVEELGAASRVSSTTVYHVDPDWQWGGRVAIGYDFPSCDPCSYYGVSLEWTWFDFDDSDSVHFPVAASSSTTFAPPPPLNPTLTGSGGFDDFFADARGKIETQYDAVDLLAHRTKMYCNSYVQWFFGARYVRLREDYDVHLGPTNFIAFDDPVLLTDPELVITEDFARFKNEFNGAGPRFGANVFYNVACGFGITGQLAGNLIYGESKSRFDEVIGESFFDIAPGTDSFVTVRNVNVPWHQNYARFIPGVSAKIGVAYRANFCNCSYLTIEAGWRGDKYFGISDTTALVQAVGLSQSRHRFDDTFTFPGDNQGLNKDANFQDFEFNGPYITLTYHA